MMRHKVLAQFGLMHMIATNLCEWLTVIIEEAKHEIEHLPHDHGDDHDHGRGNKQQLQKHLKLNKYTCICSNII